jgi:hypothetical protein
MSAGRRPPSPSRRLAIEPFAWSRHQLVMRFRLGELLFSTVYWYPGTDLLDLSIRFGRGFVERLFVHAALFEANKLASLRPSAIDLGPYAHHHTEALERLWNKVFRNVWAQWRHENDLPGEAPPPWVSRPVAASGSPVRRDRDAGRALLFCGGGKDSLVTMKLFERAGLPFASFAYASSHYGLAEPQLRLIDRLLDRAAGGPRERQIVIDDLAGAPVIELFGEALGVRTITAAETPSSIFGALPILLDRGYPHAVLGHERSANRGNLVWSATGEEVNHQWGKSLEAEALIDSYVRAELIEDVAVWSALMPLHDVLIFELLREDEGAFEATHSCNVHKPWCRRCPKCCYVWLSARAHLSDEIAPRVFGEDLLEVPDNHGFFRDMLGLGAHTPFECIGQIEESRLAIALCRARGLLGPAGRALADALPPLDVGAILDRFATAYPEEARLPGAIAAALTPRMQAAAKAARQRISATLGAHRSSTSR